MIKVTLDTNVLISGTFWTGDSFRIMELIDKKVVGCVLSKEILEEYNRILHSDEIIEKVKDKELIVSKVIQRVISDSMIVEPKTKVNIVEDADDNKFIEAALEGGSDYLISQDKHLLKLKCFKGIKIITPGQFLSLLF